MFNLDDLKREAREYMTQFRHYNSEELLCGSVIDKAIDYLASRGYINQIPEGYALVPIEPTEEMIKAAMDRDTFHHLYIDIYKAMIAAAQSDGKGE